MTKSGLKEVVLMMMFKEVDVEDILFDIALITCVCEYCAQVNHKSFSFSTKPNLKH